MALAILCARSYLLIVDSLSVSYQSFGILCFHVSILEGLPFNVEGYLGPKAVRKPFAN